MLSGEPEDALRICQDDHEAVVNVKARPGKFPNFVS